MLPDYQYKHYYDQLCEECEDEMVSQDEVYEEGGQCGECEKVMCEACREESQCFECNERLENGDDPEFDSVTVCESCTETCPSCPGLLFHRSCFAEHQRGCNQVSRAWREVSDVEAELEAKTAQAQAMRLQLAQLEQEIMDAQRRQQRARQYANRLLEQRLTCR